MKKLALLVLFAFYGFSIFAQGVGNNDYTKWGLGLRAGASLLPDFEYDLQNNFKLGFDAGVSVAYKVNKSFSIKTELLFSQQGKSYSNETKESFLSNFNGLLGAIVDTSLIGTLQGFVDDGIYSTYKGYNRLGYVEIPLMAEFNYYKFKLTAGMYAGYLVKAYNKEQLDQRIPLLDLIKPAIDSIGFAAVIFNSLISSTYPGYGQTLSTESTEKGNFTDWNYGYMLRLSYEIHKNTFLEARYTSALNSYLKDPAQNIALSSFTLSLAYNFGIKKIKG